MVIVVILFPFSGLHHRRSKFKVIGCNLLCSTPTSRPSYAYVVKNTDRMSQSLTNMPRYKLTYFDFIGPADLIRLLFVSAGVDFDDVRISLEEWPALKQKTPSGRLPILEFDGITLSESKAIARYVAKETNQYGKDNLEQARVDMIVEITDDLTAGISKAYSQKKEKHRKEMLKTHFKQESLRTLVLLEKLLIENNDGDGFFVGDKLTMADIHFFVVTGIFLEKNPSCFKHTPKLAALRKRVEEIPRIAEWLPSRPKRFTIMDL